MSPKKNSKKTSPKKEGERDASSNGLTGESPSKQGKKSTGLKLRLKVTSTESTSLIPESTSIADKSQEIKAIPKIKLNFSRSNESVVEKDTTSTGKDKGKRRGRPKKDKSAVMAAAIAASQLDVQESEEKKSRRRAAEEKIKKSASMDSMMSATSSAFEGDNESEMAADGGKRRRRRKSDDETEDQDMKKRRGRDKMNEFIDITDGPTSRSLTTHITSTSSVTGHVTPSSLTAQETEFIQRSKTFLNISMQHDTFLYTSSLSNPLDVTSFKSIEEAVEKLLAYHVGFGAGQYSKAELDNTMMMEMAADEKHVRVFEALQERYKSVLQGQSTKKVPTELLLLEQRLCLEEEKFLLVKLKNEYAARFMRGNTSGSGGSGSSGTSRPVTPAASSVNQQ